MRLILAVLFALYTYGIVYSWGERATQKKLDAYRQALRAFWRDEIPLATKNELREFHREVYARWNELLEETE